MAEEPWVQLREAISAIRAQLQQAEDDGRDEPLKLRTGPVELEFTVEIKAEGQGRAKVFVLPWTAEFQVGGARDRMHRIKLTLQPVDEHGEDKKISDHTDHRPR